MSPLSKKHLSTALMVMALAMLTFVTIKLTAPPQVVTFDIEQTLAQYQDQLIKANLSDREHTAKLADFDAKLRRLLDEYAKGHHLVILVPGAHISGAPDRTTTIQRFVIEEMKRQQQPKNE